MTKSYGYLETLRHRTWPSPKSNVARMLDSRYGVGNWCLACGVPSAGSTNCVTLLSEGKTWAGAWVPNLLYDVYCADATSWRELAGGADVEIGEIRWQGVDGGSAIHIVPELTEESFLDPTALTEATVAVHGTPGEACAVCGVFKWFGLPFDSPGMALSRVPSEREGLALASAEWFGAGLNAFRVILFQGALAEAVARSNPMDFVHVSPLLRAPGGA